MAGDGPLLLIVVVPSWEASTVSLALCTHAVIMIARVSKSRMLGSVLSEVFACLAFPRGPSLEHASLARKWCDRLRHGRTRAAPRIGR